ncbi:hypothetical protein [Roseateles aquatilis]|uniref:hypothetical protein n=1 Tax=Roseateles aquatilis TaxID=431061 RepID=UPI0011303889|nr:hypothetical protein [Roseateles aquatilis]
MNNGDEVLFRQIHPDSLQSGEPGSDRFRPSEADCDMMSVDRSSLTTAAAAHRLYTTVGKRSAAVFGLSVSEFAAQAIPCMADPVMNDPQLPDNPAHALADFSAHDMKQQKVVAKKLKRYALSRGCLFKTS